MSPVTSDHSGKEHLKASPVSLEDSVAQSLDRYFLLLGDQAPHALHDMVIHATEKPLLDYVMKRYQGNVSHAAAALGLTRNTLRRKLQFHGLSNRADKTT